MILPDAKHLEQILKVCRDAGVDAIEIGSIKVNFGAMPGASPEPSRAMGANMPTDEELAHWSVAPDPLQQRLENQ